MTELMSHTLCSRFSDVSPIPRCTTRSDSPTVKDEDEHRSIDDQRNHSNRDKAVLPPLSINPSATLSVKSSQLSPESNQLTE